MYDFSSFGSVSKELSSKELLNNYLFSKTEANIGKLQKDFRLDESQLMKSKSDINAIMLPGYQEDDAYKEKLHSENVQIKDSLEQVQYSFAVDRLYALKDLEVEGHYQNWKKDKAIKKTRKYISKCKATQVYSSDGKLVNRDDEVMEQGRNHYVGVNYSTNAYKIFHSDSVRTNMYLKQNNLLNNTTLLEKKARKTVSKNTLEAENSYGLNDSNTPMEKRVRKLNSLEQEEINQINGGNFLKNLTPESIEFLKWATIQNFSAATLANFSQPVINKLIEKQQRLSDSQNDSVKEELLKGNEAQQKYLTLNHNLTELQKSQALLKKSNEDFNHNYVSYEDLTKELMPLTQIKERQALQVAKYKKKCRALEILKKYDLAKAWDGTHVDITKFKQALTTKDDFLEDEKKLVFGDILDVSELIGAYDHEKEVLTERLAKKKEAQSQLDSQLHIDTDTAAKVKLDEELSVQAANASEKIQAELKKLEGLVKKENNPAIIETLNANIHSLQSFSPVSMLSNHSEYIQCLKDRTEDKENDLLCLERIHNCEGKLTVLDYNMKHLLHVEKMLGYEDEDRKADPYYKFRENFEESLLQKQTSLSSQKTLTKDDEALATTIKVYYEKQQNLTCTNHPEERERLKGDINKLTNYLMNVLHPKKELEQDQKNFEDRLLDARTRIQKKKDEIAGENLRKENLLRQMEEIKVHSAANDESLLKLDKEMENFFSTFGPVVGPTLQSLFQKQVASFQLGSDIEYHTKLKEMVNNDYSTDIHDLEDDLKENQYQRAQLLVKQNQLFKETVTNRLSMTKETEKLYEDSLKFHTKYFKERMAKFTSGGKKLATPEAYEKNKLNLEREKICNHLVTDMNNQCNEAKANCGKNFVTEDNLDAYVQKQVMEKLNFSTEEANQMFKAKKKLSKSNYDESTAEEGFKQMVADYIGTKKHKTQEESEKKGDVLDIQQNIMINQNLPFEDFMKATFDNKALANLIDKDDYKTLFEKSTRSIDRHSLIKVMHDQDTASSLFSQLNVNELLENHGGNSFSQANELATLLGVPGLDSPLETLAVANKIVDRNKNLSLSDLKANEERFMQTITYRTQYISSLMRTLATTRNSFYQTFQNCAVLSKLNKSVYDKKNPVGQQISMYFSGMANQVTAMRRAQGEIEFSYLLYIYHLKGLRQNNLVMSMLNFRQRPKDPVTGQQVMPFTSSDQQKVMEDVENGDMKPEMAEGEADLSPENMDQTIDKLQEVVK